MASNKSIENIDEEIYSEIENENIVNDTNVLKRNEYIGPHNRP